FCDLSVMLSSSGGYVKNRRHNVANSCTLLWIFMSVLQVLHIPLERLRTVAKPVEEVNAAIQRIVDDMFETMYAEEGIGLAATQVDIHQRIIVIDVSENRDERLVLINPELLEKSGETGIEEGCLSI